MDGADVGCALNEVVIVGGIVTDRISYYDEIPAPGQTSTPNYVKIYRGGKGANMTVMSSKLGAKTALVSKIGDDDHGQMHLSGLKENGVNIEYVEVTPGIATDMVDIAVSSGGENRIDEVSRTCMYGIKPAHVSQAEKMIKQAKVLGCILEPRVETTVTALRKGKQFGLTTLFNAAPLLDCLTITDDIYQMSDIFFCNEEEASTITGLQCQTAEDIKSACHCLLDRGFGVAIITMGARGCIYASAMNREGEHLPARKVAAVDSTGASDAFFGALCFYFARFSHLELREKIRRSMEIATISVQKEGTQASYPSVADLPAELTS